MVDEYNKRLVWLMTTLVFVICKVSMETIILNMVGVVLTVYRFKGI